MTKPDDPETVENGAGRPPGAAGGKPVCGRAAKREKPKR